MNLITIEWNRCYTTYPLTASATNTKIFKIIVQTLIYTATCNVNTTILTLISYFFLHMTYLLSFSPFLYSYMHFWGFISSLHQLLYSLYHRLSKLQFTIKYISLRFSSTIWWTIEEITFYKLFNILYWIHSKF